MASPYERLVEEKAREYGINPAIFKRLVGAESAYNPQAVSPKGARGLGQLMPQTAKELGVDPSDPVQNIDGSARYLKQQLDAFGSYPLALAAYNAGPGAVQKHKGIPPFKETRGYVQKILSNLGPSEAQAEEIPKMDPERRAELLAEAYKRGLMPPDKVQLYEEGIKRGLVKGELKSTPPIEEANVEPPPKSFNEIRADIVGSSAEAPQNGGMVRKPMPVPVPGETPEWAIEHPELHKAGVAAYNLMEPSVDMAGLTAGSIAGGAAGLPLGPAGAAGGALAGAGVGHSIAERGKDLAKQALGLQKPYGIGEGLKRSVEDVGKGAEMELLGQGLAGAVTGAGRGIKGAVSKVGHNIFKPAAEPVAGKTAPEVLQAFDDFNVTAPLGAVTGSKAAGYAEQASSGLPGSSGVMQRQADSVRNSYADAVEDITGKFSKDALRSPEAAGDFVIQTAKSAKDKFQVASKRVFDAVAQRVGNAPASLGNTKAWVQQASGAFTDDVTKAAFENSIKKELGGIYDDVAVQLPDGSVVMQPRPLSFNDLKHWRTKIGENLDNPLVADTEAASRGLKKKLYDTLTADMEQAAAQAGPDALKTFQKANQWYATQKEIHGTLEKLVHSGDAKVVGTKLLSPNISSKTVNAMRRKFTTDEWDVLSGTLFNQMGRATPGAQSAAGMEFSPATFLTNWNKMKDVRKSIFGGTRYEAVSKDIDKFATVSEALKKSTLLKNTSHTSGVSWWMNFLRSMGPAAVVGGAAGGVGGVALSTAGGVSVVASANKFAKLITNPDFVRWAATSGKLANAKALSDTQKRQMLGRLALVATRNPDIAEDVNSFLEEFATGFFDDPSTQVQ